MQHKAEFAPGWLRAQIRDSLEKLKSDPSFSHELQSFRESEEQLSNSDLFRRAEDAESKDFFSIENNSLQV